MYSNQDILHFHSSSRLAEYKANDALMMMPLRIETKIMEKRYERGYDQFNILYPLQDIWNCVSKIEAKDKEGLKNCLESLLLHINRQDIVTHEDRTHLMALLDLLKASSRTLSDDAISVLFEDIHKEADTLVYGDAVNNNRATALLEDLRHHAREIYLISDPDPKTRRIPFSGQDRNKDCKYSVTVFYRTMTKHIREAITFFKNLASSIEAVPHFDAKQKKAFCYYMSLYEKFIAYYECYTRVVMQESATGYLTLVYQRKDGESDNDFAIHKNEVYDKAFIREDLKKIRNSQYNNLTLNARSKNIAYAFKQFIESVLEFVKEVDNASVSRLKKLVKNKTLVPKKRLQQTSYTLLASMLIKWRINYIRSGKKAFDNKFLSKLTSRFENTLFRYGAEKDWMKMLASHYNKIAKKENIETLPIKDLDKNDAYMLKKPMHKHKKCKCLCVRIFPDELTVSQLEKTLTSEEIFDGKEFFRIYFHNEGEEKYEDQQQAAWDWLCRRYVPYRAAYIVRTLANNPQIKPTERKNIFNVPVSNLLPNRFAVQATVRITSGREETICRYGNALPETLQCGLNMNSTKKNPAQDQVKLEDERLKFTGGISWMTDYDEAEKVGMAVTIPLSRFACQKSHKKKTEAERLFEFKSVFVTGYREDSQTQTANELLSEMFDAHLFSEEGMDIVPMGTPTNILDNSTDTTYDTSEARQKDAYLALIKRCLAQTGENTYAWQHEEPRKGSDAELLNKLFGFSSSDSPFAEVANSNSEEMKLCKTANHHLLYYFSQKNALLKAIYNDRLLKGFFCDHVIARGCYPTLRIGAQPYGLIPIVNFSGITCNYADITSTDVLRRLLMMLTEKWNKICEMNNLADCSDEYSNSTAFLKTVSRTSRSNLFYEQDAVRCDNFLSPQYFKGVMQGVNPFLEIAQIISMHKDLRDISAEEVAMHAADARYIPIKNSVRDTNQTEWAEKAAEFLMKTIPSLENDKEQALNLVVDFFDLFYYRLDAWMQGIVGGRLNTRSGKLIIGCFGWVFDLKEAKKRDDNRIGEYLLAPSVNQALTACVLKGAYNNSKTSDADKDADVMSMNINLSSERVRKALRIVNGVRNGLPVGAVLGADLERLLHDRYKMNSNQELDRYIWPLRLAFPLVQDMEADAAIMRTEKENSPSVINGALLINSLREFIGDRIKRQTIGDYFSNRSDAAKEFNSWWQFAKVQGSVSNDHISALISIFQDIYDSYDALMDVILSESVYQLCQGNTEVVAALMNALEKETMLPIPMVTDIPVTHARIENKVIVCVEPEGSSHQQSPMAMADPSLNAWFRTVLGGKAAAFEKYGISAADIVYLSSDPEALSAYISYKCGKDAEDLSNSLNELLFVADAIRNSLNGARLLRNEDLMIESPKEEIIDNVDLEEISSNFNKALGYAEEVARRGQEFIANFVVAEGDAKNASDMNEATVNSAKEIFAMGYKLGMSEAVENLKSLQIGNAASKMSTFVQNLQIRISNAASAVSSEDASGKSKAAPAITEYTDAFRKLLSGSIMVVPSLTIDKKNVPQKSLAPRKFTNVEDSLVVDEWIRKMADVRQNMQHIYQQIMHMDWLKMEDESVNIPAFKPQQLIMNDVEQDETSTDPNSRIVAIDEWLGEEVKNEANVKDANVYLAMNADLLTKESVKALVLDFWTEKIPLQNQTAGLAFGFDQPDAEPAQAILFAANSDMSKTSRWTENKVQRSIRSARHMMINRCVEPDHIRNDKWASAIFPLINPLDRLTEKELKSALSSFMKSEEYLSYSD